jgi:hypothetical protein
MTIRIQKEGATIFTDNDTAPGGYLVVLDAHTQTVRVIVLRDTCDEGSVDAVMERLDEEQLNEDCEWMVVEDLDVEVVPPRER